MVTTIHGTPVVPGLAHGPVQVTVSDISPDALARYGDALDGSEWWQTVAYLAGLAWIAVVSVWLLALRPRPA